MEKKEGERGGLHQEWTINKIKIHLHHWLVMFVILLIYINAVNKPNQLVIGFLIGGIAHGLTYSDWYKIIT